MELVGRVHILPDGLAGLLDLGEQLLGLLGLLCVCVMACSVSAWTLAPACFRRS
jgi:hypothetical protein